MERWKAYSSITSAIAIPFVLAVTGYFIQKQLAEEGLKKDYVSIATSILKENPANQEPDLRKWAVSVLDNNSPIPFSKNAKKSLETKSPIVVPGPGIPPPIEFCMQPPQDRRVLGALESLSKEIGKVNAGRAPIETALRKFEEFADFVAQEEKEAIRTNLSLRCMQDWATMLVESDDRYRKAIGAKPSREIFEELKQKNLSSRPAPASAAIAD